MLNEMGTLCNECGDKEREKGRRLCAACRKRGQRQKQTPEIITKLLDECESYGIMVNREEGLAFRKLASAPTRDSLGGEWVVPHACKFGVHLKPDCDRVHG